MGKDRALDLGDQGNSNGETDAYKIISLQAFIHPDVEDEARCLGFMSTFNGSSDFAFDSLPYGSGLFLNFSRDYSKENSEIWKIRMIDASKGEFELM